MGDGKTMATQLTESGPVQSPVNFSIDDDWAEFPNVEAMRSRSGRSRFRTTPRLNSVTRFSSAAWCRVWANWRVCFARLWASVSIERLTPETSQHPRRVHSPQVLQDLTVDVRCSARQGVVEILAASGLVGQIPAPLEFGSLEDLGHERPGAEVYPCGRALSGRISLAVDRRPSNRPVPTVLCSGWPTLRTG